MSRITSKPDKLPQKIPSVRVDERDMFGVLRASFPRGGFTVELEQDVYYIRAPRVLTEV
jgi:hypothetical protein